MKNPLLRLFRYDLKREANCGKGWVYVDAGYSKAVLYGDGKIRTDVETFQATYATVRVLRDHRSVAVGIKGLRGGKYVERTDLPAVPAFLAEKGFTSTVN